MDVYWKDHKDMATYFRDLMKHVFTNMQFIVTGLISLSIADKIDSIIFINGFNFVLGFDGVNLSCSEKHFIAFTHLNYVRRELGQMFIYGNCCAPLHVDDVTVPLLRNVHIDFGKNDE